MRVYGKQVDDHLNDVLDLLRKVRTYYLREERRETGTAPTKNGSQITRRFLCAEDDDSLIFELDGDTVCVCALTRLTPTASFYAHTRLVFSFAFSPIHVWRAYRATACLLCRAD